MSGFQRDGKFDLTATKAEYWHRSCGCADLEMEDIYRVHLEPAGFIRHPAPSVHMLRLSGPGIAEGATDHLYRAISGRR